MNEYPLHWYVFENDCDALKQHLKRVSKNEIDKKDLRNKTPLELAIFLEHVECAKILVEHGADCGSITKMGWNLVQEAVSTSNIDLIKLVIAHRELQRTTARKNGIPELLNKLKQAPDFYVEMKWEFTSWIPLISKACPSDVYKIYKSGSNVRIDTTLIGFNGTNWERGNRSFIFQATQDGSANIIEIDHLLRTYHIDKLNTGESDDMSESVDLYEPDENVIQNKLLSPNIVTFLDIEKIEFERNRSGIWGWRSDKNETINNYDCKVYTANNLQLVTKTRVEHLSSDRAKSFLNDLDENDDFQNQLKQNNSNIPGFLTNFFQGSEQHIKVEKSNKKLTALEYFHKAVNVDYYLNGSVRKIDETRKIQTFNATLSLCDYYPLSLHEQVSPIIDLMALNNSHFKKLKEFITLQLPSGFPVKIEIPIYRVITAKVTFGNIHALDSHVDYVTTIKNASLPRDNSLINSQDDAENSFLLPTEDVDQYQARSYRSKAQSASMCVVDEKIFKIPSSYRCTNHYLLPFDSSSLLDGDASSNNRNERRFQGAGAIANDHRRVNYYGQNVDDDDILLQLAIQQSVAMANNNSSNTEINEEQLTALEMFGHRTNSITQPRDTSGGTQSLEEFHERQNNLILSQTDEQLMLQRVLAESLLTSNQTPRAITNNFESQTNNSSNFGAEMSNDDATLRQILELSKKEEEERLRRLQEEEEQLRQILELSLTEK